MLVILIVAAEVAFWLVLGAGLSARYLLRRRRLGLVLLAATPFIAISSSYTLWPQEARNGAG
jgi:hypothetical protein